MKHSSLYILIIFLLEIMITKQTHRLTAALRWICLILLGLTAHIAQADNTRNAPSPIHQYTLKNGLKLLVKEDHRSPAIVTMIWYKVGSAYEPLGITGISHALEHMMFKGTPRYPAGQFSKIIAENGGEENAFTSQDYTAYFEKLDRSLLPLAFKLEADRMQNLSLKAEEYNKEIQVVREERHMRVDDNPQGLTFERFLAAAFLSTPYHNPTIGWPDDLNNMKIEDLRQWYHTWYVPNNATLVVVGDVKPENVLAEAQKAFEKIPSRSVPITKPHKEPSELGARKVKVNAPAKIPSLIMGYIVPSRASKPDSWKPYALTVLSGILSSGESSRLPSNLIREKQIASQAEAYYDMYSLFNTPFMFFGSPSKDHSLKALKEAFQKEIQLLQEKPVSSGELEKIKNQIIAQQIYSRDSAYEQALEIGLLASIGLPPDSAEKDVEKIQAVTAAQVQAVAKEYLAPNRLTTAMLIPQSLQPESKEKTR